jgi:hypothetical protein
MLLAQAPTRRCSVLARVQPLSAAPWALLCPAPWLLPVLAVAVLQQLVHVLAFSQGASQLVLVVRLVVLLQAAAALQEQQAVVAL